MKSHSSLKIILIALLLTLTLSASNLPQIAKADPGYEDFTTYTEVDTANDRIQRTSNHVDHLATRNEDTYLYSDKGAEHFTDFEHNVDVRSDFEQTYATGVLWMLSNDLDDWLGLHGASKTYVLVRCGALIANRIDLYEGYNGNVYSDLSTVELSADTWYYLTISKTGTSLECTIYSDSDRTDLLETLSLTLQADHSFRYVFACNTYNSGDTYYLNNDIENLDLQEGVTKNFFGHVSTVTTVLGLKAANVSVNVDAIQRLMVNSTFEIQRLINVWAIITQGIIITTVNSLPAEVDTALALAAIAFILAVAAFVLVVNKKD